MRSRLDGRCRTPVRRPRCVAWPPSERLSTSLTDPPGTNTRRPLSRCARVNLVTLAGSWPLPGVAVRGPDERRQTQSIARRTPDSAERLEAASRGCTRARVRACAGARGRAEAARPSPCRLARQSAAVTSAEPTTSPTRRAGASSRVSPSRRGAVTPRELGRAGRCGGGDPQRPRTRPNARSGAATSTQPRTAAEATRVWWARPAAPRNSRGDADRCGL